MRRLFRRSLAVLAALAVAWAAWGVHVRAERAPRPAPPPGEIRGAWHVHTTRSDGRGTLAEVVRAAREAGLQFVVIADHNALAREEQGWHDGVLVVTATEASTRLGHIVAVGLDRPLGPEEREQRPLESIAGHGGTAVLAHPLHPTRPFTGWAEGPWRGFEVVSNDTSWHEVVARRDVGRVTRAALLLPWDGARAVLALSGSPADELERFDAELARARLRERDPRARPQHVLLCSADAHGYPSYGAAFGAFSMHVPLTPSGDGDADARGVVQALLEGRAACVFDGVAPASRVALAPVRADGQLAFELRLEAPDLSRARFRLVRDGAPVAEAAAPAAGGAVAVRLACDGGCGPGDYRAEATWEGRTWIFTNPVSIE